VKIYTVPGVPPQLAGTAFAPHFNRLAASGAQQYKQGLTGQPGTQGIAAPTRDTAPSPDPGDIAQMGTSRSGDAPDTWYPQLWYQANLKGNPGPVTPVAIYSNNLMPAPAVDPRGTPARLSRPVNQRGQRQVQTTPLMPRWT
jgi:hypothetical protein